MAPVDAPRCGKTWPDYIPIETCDPAWAAKDKETDSVKHVLAVFVNIIPVKRVNVWLIVLGVIWEIPLIDHLVVYVKSGVFDSDRGASIEAVVVEGQRRRVQTGDREAHCPAQVRATCTFDVQHARA